MQKENHLNADEFLKPQNMIRLYASGAFPMADEESGEISWYMPDIRTIIPLDGYNIPRSLKKFIARTSFEVKYDSDFLSVIKGCSSREKTWISGRLIDAYIALEKLGHVHSVETWRGNKLVGGLYGITNNGAFFGESMFSLEPQASKFALVKLIEHLIEKEFTLLDVQYMTEHLKMFGAKEIPFEEFDRLLRVAYARECKF